MRVAVVSIMVADLLFSPLMASAYDLSNSRKDKRLTAPVTVALVPFAERRDSAVDGLMDRLSRDLRKKGGLRVMDRTKTDEILQYYLTYVNIASEDSAVQRSLTEARQSLLAGSYPAASKLLDDAERKIVARAAGGGSNEGLYQLHLVRAKIHHANGIDSAVQRDYDAIVRLHPDLELDANLYSNWERAALQKAREKMAGERTASIEVRSTPEGSEVFLNGVHRGISPMTLKDLPPGLHVVEVKTVHHASVIRQVQLHPSETATVKAELPRTDFAQSSEGVTIRPSLYKNDLEVSRLISTLGYHLGVDKIVLVADKDDSLVYRTGDTRLGAVQRQFKVALASSASGSGVPVLVSELGKEISTDVLTDPSQYADQSVGSLDLMHKRKKPFYKKPLFWILVGVAAGTGGALGAVLGAGGAATGGIFMGF